MKKVIIEQSGQESIILNVPEGASVRIDDGVAIVEPKFKKGDILYFNNGEGLSWILVFKKINESNSNPIDYFIMLVNGELRFNYFCRTSSMTITHATPEQAQILFDALTREGKRWDSEKLEVVDLKYTPKVGDCVKIIYPSGNTYFCEVSNVDGYQIESRNVEITPKGVNFKNYPEYLTYDSVEKITPEELQAEFNKRGYEYDFETHTAKVWKPKNGEKYCCVTANGGRMYQTWYNNRFDNARFEIKNVFHPKDKEGIEKYIAHIKSFER